MISLPIECLSHAYAYEVVKKFLEDKESKAVRLLIRISRYYLHGFEHEKTGKKTKPRFPPFMWSQHRRVLAEEPTTTNWLEGNHRAYDYKFATNHPS